MSKLKLTRLTLRMLTTTQLRSAVGGTSTTTTQEIKPTLTDQQNPVDTRPLA